MTQNRYFIHSRDNARRQYYRQNGNCFVLSLVDTEANPPEFTKDIDISMKKIVHVDDLRVYKDNSLPDNAVREVLEWHKTVPMDATIIVHCSRGIARSPAMALIMMASDGISLHNSIHMIKERRLNELSDPEFSRDTSSFMFPNPVIIACGDAQLNLNGELIKIVKNKLSP